MRTMNREGDRGMQWIGRQNQFQRRLQQSINPDSEALRREKWNNKMMRADGNAPEEISKSNGLTVAKMIT